ncbi:MAG: DUF624 domain-containing protein [Lachnospiraceae bacterium]|jgi:uncharacterized membrane protein YesL|nr:DUF624 domain-containing protein [Lachnospiraceae bacterium]MCX4304505.1 DUF624 domain-containing protein [Acetatifactor sp.]
MNLFSMNSPFARGMRRLVMMLHAGLLWFLCSIPLVTAGAATAALYEVLLQAVKDREGYVGSSFFRAFRGNLRQGIPLGLLTLAAGVVAGVNVFYYGVLGGEAFRLQAVLFGILFLLVLTVSSYLFAAMAKFRNTVGGHIRMALVLTFRNIGWSAAVLVIQVLTLFLIWFFVWFPLLFIMGISGYLQAAIFDHIFEKLIDNGMILETDAPADSSDG